MAIRMVLLFLGAVATFTAALPFDNAGNFTEYEQLVMVFNGVEMGYEEMYFIKQKGLIWFEGSDGSFTAQDLKKALKVTKSSGESDCFVTPIETSQEDSEVVELMTNSTRQVTERTAVKMIPDDSIYINLSGSIQDTSFLPDDAVERCDAGIFWRFPTGNKQTTKTSSGRVKRACEYSCNLEYDSSCKCYKAKCGFKC